MLKRFVTSSGLMILAVAAVALLGMAPAAVAQVTDFSGTWSFDAAKSTGKPEPVSLAGGEAPEVTSDGRVGAGGIPGGGNFALQPAGGRNAKEVDAFRLVIKQTPSDVNILDGGVALAFKLDGTEQNISALNRAGYPKGKAAWDGDKLVLSTRQDVYVGHAQFDSRTTKDVYSIQGGMLTIEKMEQFQGKTRALKLVYARPSS